MARLRLSLLGGFEARLAPGSAVSLPTKKAQALLAYLAVRPGQRHHRDKLAALLWGEKTDDQARDGLRHALVALRRALGKAQSRVLRIEGQTLAVDPARIEVDVASFERHVAEKTVSALEHAAELYRDDLLAGFSVNEPLFEDWLITQRERLREMALDALAQLLAHQTKTARTERAIQTALRLLALDPLQEAVHRTLMRLYARQRRRGAALKQYQVCVNALRRELGAEPEAETRRLYRELLRRPAEPAPHVEAHDEARPDLPAAETPLFGRRIELDRLRRMLDWAIGSHGHVATVLGEAGIGKTRLVDTLAADALARGCRVLIGRCHESDSILPFGPWVDAFRNGSVSTDEQLLAALHLSWRAELARLLPQAGRAGLPRPSDSALALFESVAALVEHLAARQPLMLVLEDLHWADEMSLRLLAFVSRRVSRWRALVIVTARDEELAGAATALRTLDELSRTSADALIMLSPLSRADTALLVRALARIGSDAHTLTRVEAHAWATSEGNPFVAVEVVRALEQKMPEGGARAEPEGRALPARVRELVARRLDRLSPRGEKLAAIAAVIGRRFPFALLCAAGDAGERDTAEAVEEMVRHRVLQAAGNELDFTHDRVRDVAYGRLLPSRRQLLHRAVADALERTGASTELVDQLAHHALRGELGEKAAHYLRRAGMRAAAQSALHDARAWFDQALAALQALPETRSTLEEAFEIRLELRLALTQLGEFERALKILREAESIAERLNDEVRLGRVYAFLANVQARLDDPLQAIVSGERALEIAERHGDLGLRILTTSFLALAYFYRGEYTRVIELTTTNLAALPPDRLHDFFGSSQPASVNTYFRLIASLAHLGRFAEALRHEPAIIGLAEHTRHPYAIGLAYHAASMPHLIQGNWAKAHALIERQIAAWRTANVGDIPMTLAYSARVLAYLGDGTEALSRLREAEQLLAERSASGQSGGGNVYSLLGRACLPLGRLDDARRFAERAVATASGRIDVVPYTRLLLGEIASHLDRLDAGRGEAHYVEALVLAQARGMRPLIAHCHLGLGRLYARTKDPRRAREHFDAAATLYREMDMRHWLAEVG